MALRSPPALAVLVILALASACSSGDGTPSAEALRSRADAALRGGDGAVLHARSELIGVDPPGVIESWFHREAGAWRIALPPGHPRNRAHVLLGLGEAFYPNLPALDSLDLRSAGLAQLVLLAPERPESDAVVTRIEAGGRVVWRLEQDARVFPEQGAEGGYCQSVRQDFDGETALPLALWEKPCEVASFEESHRLFGFEVVEFLDRASLPAGFFDPAAIRSELLERDLDALAEGPAPAFWLGEDTMGWRPQRVLPWHDAGEGPRAVLEYTRHALPSRPSAEVTLSPAGEPQRLACDPLAIEEVATTFGPAEYCSVTGESGALRLLFEETAIVVSSATLERGELVVLAGALRLVRPEPQLSAPSALWLIEVESGRTTVLYEGEGQAYARFDPGGAMVSTLVYLPDDAGWLAQRFELDGRVIEAHDDRLLMYLSPDGRSRYYTSVAPNDLPRSRMVLQRDGSPVPLNAPRGTYAAGFSPGGDRLLAGSGALENPSTVLFTYQIYSVETGDVLGSLEIRAREGADGGELPRWSPSGRYIAASGTDGLFVYDTETTESVRLGTGLPRWSPAEDAILAVDEDGNVDVVRFPEARRSRVGGALVEGHPPLFGAAGRFVYWDDAFGVTTAFRATHGGALAMWLGSTDPYGYVGVDPLTFFRSGMSAVLRSSDEGCRGLIVYVAVGGVPRCLEGGAAARWSPDGRLLAYASGDELHVLDVSTGAERVLARGIDPADYGEGAFARWSPDGTHLLVQWPSGGIGWSEE